VITTRGRVKVVQTAHAAANILCATEILGVEALFEAQTSEVKYVLETGRKKCSFKEAIRGEEEAGSRLTWK
jgi:hypothetical protein